jgi:misacylated tRNA(Ala) deacylase
MTQELFRDDAYLAACAAAVTAARPDGLVLDRTVFYYESGGQPGDCGKLVRQSDGAVVPIADTKRDKATGAILHIPAPGAPTLAAGDAVTAEIDWARRYRLMRMHTALHLLSVVLPYPVTGGAVGVEDGRLDFDIPEAGVDREAVSAELNRLIATDAAVSDRMIAEEELDRNPQLVKTLSVKPPRGTGTIRLVEIAGLDLQPCGGTHVRRTGEIGRVDITAIEKKGKMNRRVRIAFA